MKKVGWSLVLALVLILITHMSLASESGVASLNVELGVIPELPSNEEFLDITCENVNAAPALYADHIALLNGRLINHLSVVADYYGKWHDDLSSWERSDSATTYEKDSATARQKGAAGTPPPATYDPLYKSAENLLAVGKQVSSVRTALNKHLRKLGRKLKECVGENPHLAEALVELDKYISMNEEHLSSVSNYFQLSGLSLSRDVALWKSESETQKTLPPGYFAPLEEGRDRFAEASRLVGENAGFAGAQYQSFLDRLAPTFLQLARSCAPR